MESVNGLIEAGSYAQAEKLAREFLQEAERAHGAHSLEAAEVLDALVKALRRGGKAKAPESRQLAERAVKIKEEVLGSEHPDVASSLSNLAMLLDKMGDYAGARRVHERALGIREKTLGPEHLHVASSLTSVAMMLDRTGDFAGAKPMYERALAIREKALGSEHLHVASSLNNLAILLWKMGDYAGAKPLFERALATKIKALGPEDPRVARSLNNLGALLDEMGDFVGAKPLVERALSIWENALGPEHPDVAGSLNNLASLLNDMGDYVGARRLYERALTIREKALGPGHPDVAMTLGNLAMLLDDMGDYAGARRLYERALSIREKALGPEHPEVAQNLNNLGLLLGSVGDHAGAKRLYERALAIREKALDPEHPHVATSLNNLAHLLYEMGDYAGAKELFERALAIWEKALGPEHPEVAHSVHGLAKLFAEAGDFSRAKKMFGRVLAIKEKAFGPEHPDVATSLNNLANLFYVMGDPEEALKHAYRAEEISREHLRLTAASLPEQQTLRYAFSRSSGMDIILSHSVQAERPGSVHGLPASIWNAWDALIRSRALVLDEMAQRNRVVAEVPELSGVAARFALASRCLANLLVRGPGREPPERYRKMVEQARMDREKAERALAESSRFFRSGFAMKKTGMKEVLASLPKDSALVAYSRYDETRIEERKPAFRKAKSQDAAGRVSASKPTIPSYMAFVLPSGEEDPVAVPLGTAKEIEALISRWRIEAGHGIETDEKAYRDAGRLLREKVWDPIAVHLGTAGRAFLVPDGELQLVSFASLPCADEGYLIEKGPLIHYLSAERDLVPSGMTEFEGEGLLALGDPAFGKTSLVASVAEARNPDSKGLIEEAAALIPFRGEPSACGDFQALRFGPLPGTAREADDVLAVWKKASHPSGEDGKSVLLRRAEASEAAFKAQAPGKRALHLATHGFFLSGRCPSALATSRGINRKVSPHQEKPPPPAGENPLHLSGLALAGFNHRDKAGENEEDGVLTAEEIAALDLSGVEWAVLSACETGVGDVRAGEGVFGLRRAFQVAGVDTLIMSLWSVEDEATRTWMRALYDARLFRRMDTAQAVREASLTVLRNRREQGQSTHPFYWAGFVAAGDWK